MDKLKTNIRELENKISLLFNDFYKENGECEIEVYSVREFEGIDGSPDSEKLVKSGAIVSIRLYGEWYIWISRIANMHLFFMNCAYNLQIYVFL